MKKQKKKKQIVDFVVGDKIRDVKVSEKQHFLLFVTILILCNIMLVASTMFLLIYLRNVVNCIIAIVAMVLCGWYSFKIYRKMKSYHKCAIYQNALVVNSIWMNIVIDLKNIYDIKIKKSLLDNLFITNTYSMEFYITNQKRRKFTLFFVEEDAQALKNEILELISQQK